jgi:uroporphyrinogen decarboxylase
MNPRETVQAAFRFEETEIVPYWIPMDKEVERRLDKYYDTPSWRDQIVPYLFGTHVGAPTTPLGDRTAIDGFGSIVEHGNIWHVEKAVLSSPSLKGYEWPDPVDLIDWDELTQKYASHENSFRLCGFAFGLFERAWLMRGFENVLMDMLDHPTFVENLLDGITQVHLRAMDLIVARLPIEAYFAGGDDCDQRGPIMGLKLWRKFIKPHQARLIAHCHELGLPYVAHHCGNVAPLVDDFIEIGMDALESLQPEAMDVYELKRKTAGRLVLIGGLGNQSTLPFGSPEDVRTETQRIIRELGRGGGYVLGPSKALLPDTPIENIIAFVETATQQPII